MSTNRRFIPTPPETVWRVLADPESYAYWVVGSKRIRAADPSWPAAGSRFHHTVGFGPFTVDDHTESVADEPPRRLELRAKARPLGLAEVILELEPAGGGRRSPYGEPDRHPEAARAVAPLQCCQGAQPRVARTDRGARAGAGRLMTDRAVVVGSGPNGLAAAIELARGGVEVTVLEAAQRAGGAVATQELTLPGFRHDVFSAVYPAAAASPVFARWPLERARAALDPPAPLLRAPAARGPRRRRCPATSARPRPRSTRCIPATARRGRRSPVPTSSTSAPGAS